MEELHGGASPKKRPSFDQLALLTLAGTLVLAFLVFTTSPAVSFIGTKTLVILGGTVIAFALYIIGRLTRGSIVIPPTLLIPAFWIVPAAYGISTLFSGVNPARAFFGSEFEIDTLGFILGLATLATLIALVVRREKDYSLFLRIVGIAFSVLVVVSFLLILAARLFPNMIAPLSNVVGSFADLGMLVGLGLVVLLIAFRFLSLTGKAKILFVGTIAIGLLILSLANSPLVWALLGFTSLGLFIETLLRRQKVADDPELIGVATPTADADEVHGESRPLALPLIVLVVSVFFLITGSSVGNALASWFGTSFIDVRPSWQSTFQVGSHVYASSPLFGSGPGTFADQLVMFRDRAINDTIFWSVDFVSGIGYIPTAAVTTGIVGVIAWLVFLGMFLFVGVHALLFRLPRDRFLRFVSVASFAGAAYVLTLAVLAIPGPVVLAAGFAALGLFASSVRYGRERVEWGVVFSRVPRIGFVLVFGLTILLLVSMFAGYAVISRYIASLAYGEAATALAAGNLDAADAAIARSATLAPTDRVYRLAAAAGVARMSQIATSQTLSETDAQQQFQVALSSAIQAAGAATQLAPTNYQNWLALGGVYQTVVPLNIAGAADAAEAAYVQAGTLAPSNPVIPYTLAQLDIAANDYASAESRLLATIALKRDYTQAILLLSQLQVQMGKAAEALQAVEAAVYFAPNDAATLFQAGVLRLGTNDVNGSIAALSRAVELNTRYANARFFLAVAYSVNKNYEAAIAQLQEVATLSPENEAAVAADLALLREGKNPYPAARLKTLGIPSAPVAEPEPDPSAETPE